MRRGEKALYPRLARAGEFYASEAVGIAADPGDGSGYFENLALVAGIGSLGVVVVGR
jgi:hypothetical protein